MKISNLKAKSHIDRVLDGERTNLFLIKNKYFKECLDNI